MKAKIPPSVSESYIMKLRSGLDASKPVQVPAKATNKTKTSATLHQETRIEGKAAHSKTEAATKDTTRGSSVSLASTAVTKADKKIRKKQRGKKKKNKAFLASLAAGVHSADNQFVSGDPSLPGTWPKTPPQSLTRNHALEGGPQTTWIDPSLPGRWPKTPPQHSSHRGYNKPSTGRINSKRHQSKNLTGSRNERRLPNNAQVSVPRDSFHKGFFKPNFSPNDNVITEQLDDIKTTFKTIEDELIAAALIMDNISSSGVALKEDLSNMVWRMYFSYNAAQTINDTYLHLRRSQEFD